MNHTVGTWTAHGRGIFAGDVMVGLASHPRDVEEEPDGKFPPYEEAIANAAIMAAAPAMLAALRLFIAAEDEWNARDGTFDDPLTDAYHAARAAIARATGTAP